MTLQSRKNFSWTRFQEKEKVSEFTEDAVNDGCVWVAFPAVCFFPTMVSFCNENIDKINLFAPCCFISVLWLSAPLGS